MISHNNTLIEINLNFLTKILFIKLISVFESNTIKISTLLILMIIFLILII